VLEVQRIRNQPPEIADFQSFFRQGAIALARLLRAWFSRIGALGRIEKFPQCAGALLQEVTDRILSKNENVSLKRRPSKFGIATGGTQLSKIVAESGTRLEVFLRS
jgi:hypothetical protein